MSENQIKENKFPLSLIVGEQLSAVIFVQDYLQLQFDGPTLTLLNWPIIEIGGNQIHYRTEEYRNKLCELIGRLVTDVSSKEEKNMRIDFEYQATLFVSLELENSAVTEVVTFDDGRGGYYVW